MATRIIQGNTQPLSWPETAGTYLLIFRVESPISFTAGRLGAYTLSPGTYLYIGSAQGPGGLAARIGRHLRAEKRQHWHVDALTASLPVAAVGVTAGPERLECAWVRHLLAGGARAPIPGFGSSDCRAGCPAHLLRLPGEAGEHSALAHLGVTLMKRVDA